MKIVKAKLNFSFGVFSLPMQFWNQSYEVKRTEGDLTKQIMVSYIPKCYDLEPISVTTYVVNFENPYQLTL